MMYKLRTEGVLKLQQRFETLKLATAWHTETMLQLVHRMEQHSLRVEQEAEAVVEPLNSTQQVVGKPQPLSHICTVENCHSSRAGHLRQMSRQLG